VVDGNDMEPLLSTYYGQDASGAIAKADPANTDEMTGFLLDKGRQLLGNIPDKSKLTPDTRIPMRGGPHVWSLRPGDPKVRKVLESPGDAAEFKNQERDKYDKQKATPQSPELTETLLDDVFQDWPDRIKGEFLATLATPAATDADDLTNKMDQFFAANYPNAHDEAQVRASASVMKNVALPVELAGGKLAAHVDDLLKKLNLSAKDQSAVKGAVMAGYNVAGQTPPTSVNMTKLQADIVKAMKGNIPGLDEAQAKKDVYKAQKPEPAPPGLPFGDSNWGGGDHHILFTMVRNPKTGNLEMWQCNEDGSAPTMMDAAQWIDGQRYEMVTDPAMVGGLV